MMPLEIEAKMKIADPRILRDKLRALGATRRSEQLETNTFFDTAGAALKSAGKGLRLRRNKSLSGGQDQVVITFKGPLQAGAFKSRPEIEIVVDDESAAVELLQALGFSPLLSFEKRRESWKLDACEVDLDLLPHLGSFVEIEGPSEAAVAAVRRTLGLTEPTIKAAYIALLLDCLRQKGIADRCVRFESHEAPPP